MITFSHIRRPPQPQELQSALSSASSGSSSSLCDDPAVQLVQRQLTAVADVYSLLLDEAHPFFADLLNVVADRSEIQGATRKLREASQALCQEDHRSPAVDEQPGDKSIIDRFMGLVKGPLNFLSELHEYIVRFPSIDPSARTLLVAGYPNVGKSSLVNRLTRANVEIQPYPFTTKSLFVGQMAHKSVNWQVIDTPGLLDHPLEDRNMIEMQAVAALCHLGMACILYVMDLSEECGYRIVEQVELLRSLRPLFVAGSVKRPIVIVLTKCDVRRIEDVDEGARAEIVRLAKELGAHCQAISTATGEGFDELKSHCCEAVAAADVVAAGKRGEDDVRRGTIMVKDPGPHVT